MIQPAPGVLLIADPFLKDPNFARTVVFICENDDKGTFGFVLNKQYEHTLDELLDDLEGFPIPIYCGGPVQLNTIHFLHQYPDMVPDSIPVGNSIYWGGNFEAMAALIKTKSIDLDKVKFFIGYSGWSEGQLAEELEEKSWIAVDATRKLVFDIKHDEVWKGSLHHLGGEYELLVNYPVDPQLN